MTTTFTVPPGLPFFQAVEARGQTDKSDRTAYRGRVVVLADGRVLVQSLRADRNGGTTILRETFAGWKASSGQTLTLQLSTIGDTPSVTARAWPAGASGSAAEVSSLDESAARISTAGAVGLLSYLSGSARSAVSVAFASFEAQVGTSTGSEPPPPPTQDTFTVGTTKPDASNTGVTAGTVLTPVVGDVTFSTPNQVVEGKDFQGHVYVRANGVTFRNCRFRGPASNTGFVTFGLLAAEYGYTGITVDRSTFNPDIPKWWVVGVRGAGFTVTRSQFSRVVDGLVFFGGSATATANYVHDLSFFDNSQDQKNDSYHPYWTHNDGIQIEGGTGHTIVGNNFQAYAATDAGRPATLTNNGYPKRNWPVGITVSPYRTATSGNLVDQNWFEGGAAGFQMNQLNPNGAANNFGTISNNRFGMDQWDFGRGSRYQIRYKSGWIISGLSSNYFDPDSASVPAAKKGQRFTVGFDTGIRVD